MSNGINPVKKNPVMGPAKTLMLPGGAQAVTLSGLCMMNQLQAGALTANTWKQMLNLSGPGVLEFVALSSDDATSRTLYVQVVIDGVTVVNTGAGMPAASGNGMVAVGCYQSGSAYAKQPLPFKTSCVVSIQSSLTETNKSTLCTAYRTC